MEGQVSPTRIAIVDGEILLRELLHSNLSQHVGQEVVWTADNVGEAMPRLVEAQPDVLLVDLHPRNGDFFELTRNLRRHQADTKVIVLTNISADVYIERAQMSHISGYLLKSDSLQAVVEAVEQAVQGGVSYSHTIRKRLRIDPTTQQLKMPHSQRSTQLTDRELEMLQHLATGEAVKTVAKRLHLTPKTVESHKYRIMRKLNLRNRVELARFAIREGLATA